MDPWQRRIHRAQELARRFPLSAELMYFYRDIARFQSAHTATDDAALRAFLRRDPEAPLAAFLRRVLDSPAPHHGPCVPLAAIRRAEGRFLLCAGCFTEIPAPPPGTCPSCARAPLRIHTGAEFPHIRVEACDHCRAYLKSIDLALDPAAVPEIDELAAVPLDLWAVRHGYRKPAPNLFGL